MTQTERAEIVARVALFGQVDSTSEYTIVRVERMVARLREDDRAVGWLSDLPLRRGSSMIRVEHLRAAGIDENIIQDALLIAQGQTTDVATHLDTLILSKSVRAMTVYLLMIRTLVGVRQDIVNRRWLDFVIYALEAELQRLVPVEPESSGPRSVSLATVPR